MHWSTLELSCCSVGFGLASQENTMAFGRCTQQNVTKMFWIISVSVSRKWGHFPFSSLISLRRQMVMRELCKNATDYIPFSLSGNKSNIFFSQEDKDQLNVRMEVTKERIEWEKWSLSKWWELYFEGNVALSDIWWSGAGWGAFHDLPSITRIRCREGRPHTHNFLAVPHTPSTAEGEWFVVTCSELKYGNLWRSSHCCLQMNSLLSLAITTSVTANSTVAESQVHCLKPGKITIMSRDTIIAEDEYSVTSYTCMAMIRAFIDII